jgi:hypothetical protein
MQLNFRDKIFVAAIHTKNTEKDIEVVIQNFDGFVFLNRERNQVPVPT